MRKSVAVVVAALFLGLLTGCSAAGGGACTPALPTGDASKLISATGPVGSTPKVTFPTPVVTKTAEVSTITVGKGELVRPGMVADVEASLFNGKTGQQVAATKYDLSDAPRLTAGGKTDPFSASIQCATVGSRLALVVSVKQYFGAAGPDPSLGLAPADSLIFVTDIKRAFLGRASGVPGFSQDGMPAVVTAPDGTPGVTIPNTSPPTNLRIETVTVGGGAKVKQNDQVVVHYSGFVWASTSTDAFDTTWTKHAPVTWHVSSTDATNGVPVGLEKALVGQTVGSQVLVAMPPKFGFSSSKLPAGVDAGATLLYVIDILGIQ